MNCYAAAKISALHNGINCPCCASPIFVPYLEEDKVAREIQLRTTFVQERLDHSPEPTELMDLTEFMHGGPGRLLKCPGCGVVVREEAGAAHYQDDFYDSAWMAHLYPRYLAAFREKESQYRQLLPARANVLELGSHFGAFLQAAEEWNWRPIGIDIGAYTSEFARARGFSVQRRSIADVSLRSERSDALFIWNCLEQLERPADELAAAHRLLKPHGLLVVRVPNLRFYAHWRRKIWSRKHHVAVQRLGYNNLLGFPYRFGYTGSTLTRLLRQCGFRPIAGHNANLITMPFTTIPRWVRKEYSAVRRSCVRSPNRENHDLKKMHGPWIEIVARRVT